MPVGIDGVSHRKVEVLEPTDGCNGDVFWLHHVRVIGTSHDQPNTVSPESAQGARFVFCAVRYRFDCRMQPESAPASLVMRSIENTVEVREMQIQAVLDELVLFRQQTPFRNAPSIFLLSNSWGQSHRLPAG